MSVHLHHLTGCAPVPLAHYLKGLGVLRLVAEQKDPQARGWWQDEHFCLLTTLDREALRAFFLYDYRPTPFVSPWNKGSGFYYDNDPALSPLVHSAAPRFSAFREGIAAGFAPLASIKTADAAVRALKAKTKVKKDMTAGEKKAAKALKNNSTFKHELATAERTFKELKANLFAPCLRNWRGAHRAWLDAALVWLDEGKPAWPSLLGTGGNDGRLDFTNNAMQRIGELFDLESPEGAPTQDAAALLDIAFWSSPAPALVEGAAIGQFLPGAAGGANSSTGADGDSSVNPWDFVLMLEGTVLFSARATRRLDPGAVHRASAPFAVRTHGAGVATRGREDAQRGEQWMPLWSEPTTAAALIAMLGEARMQLGRGVAHRPLDAARAISRLGVARGISGFVRYGYLERVGQSKIAVPLGRLDVRARVRSRLIDDLASWLDALQRLTRDEHTPARLVSSEAVLADAVFAALTHDDTADRWQTVLLAASDVESVQASGTGFSAGPIPPLNPEWLAAADDGSVEWRLACALGSAASGYDHARPRDPIRAHFLPLTRDGRRFREKDRRLFADPRVVAGGRDPIAACVAIVQRRLIEASKRGSRSLPLVAASRFAARASDLAELLCGRVDLARVFRLARSLAAVRWDRTDGIRPKSPTRHDFRLDEPWMAVRLCHLPWAVDDGRNVPCDAAIVRRLAAGDAGSALTAATRRLGAVGLRPPFASACIDPITARLWAASLAFPISRSTAVALARELEPLKEIR